MIQRYFGKEKQPPQAEPKDAHHCLPICGKQIAAQTKSKHRTRQHAFSYKSRNNCCVTVWHSACGCTSFSFFQSFSSGGSQVGASIFWPGWLEKRPSYRCGAKTLTFVCHTIDKVRFCVSSSSMSSARTSRNSFALIRIVEKQTLLSSNISKILPVVESVATAFGIS